MPTFNKCCCCSLKLGCKIIGALAIIDHGYKVTQSMTEIVEENIKSDDQKNQEIEDLIEGMDVLGISLNKSSVEQWLFHVYITAFIDVIFSMIGLISYGCLWFGVFKDKDQFLLPALVFIPFEFLKCAATSVVFANDLGFTNPISIFTQSFIIFNILVLFPIWLMIYSYKQVLKDGGDRETGGYSLTARKEGQF